MLKQEWERQADREAEEHKWKICNRQGFVVTLTAQ